MLKSIGDIWFGCSQEVGCFSEGLLREDLHYLSLVELLVCILGLVLFYEYHDFCYKIYRIGSFSYKTLFSCLVELPGNKKPQGP